MDDLVERVAATVAQFFGENDTPGDVARAIIPIVLEEARRLCEGELMLSEGGSHDQGVYGCIGAIRSRAAEMTTKPQCTDLADDALDCIDAARDGRNGA